MKNKSVNMKKLIATPFLFCLSLFTFQVQAQESVDVLIRDNGTERKESIELPPSMTYPLLYGLLITAGSILILRSGVISKLDNSASTYASMTDIR